MFDEDQEYEDMIKMNELTAESILRNLSIRYAKNKIYTFIGDIVVSVNPYKSLPDLYTSAVMRQYANDKAESLLPPHVFSVAAAAFKDMIEKVSMLCFHFLVFLRLFSSSFSSSSSSF